MNSSNKDDVRHQFGSNATRYVSSAWHAAGEDLKKLVEITELTGAEHVLDVATGGGHVANALAALANEVTALDLTSEILAAAKEIHPKNGHSNIHYALGDAEKMQYPDGQFDVVTCRIAPHHFPNVKAFISETYRVLKEKGQFLLIDNTAPEVKEFDEFYNEVEKRRDFSHCRAWKKSEWISFLETAGFVIEEWHRFPKTFLFDDWCNRMNLSNESKQSLARYMMNSSEACHKKFHIKINEKSVYSFEGESVLLKAVKP
ncbi:class I SAM-dependent methyltransferase [Alteribacillus bidgolensis]|uniref:Methyltransferase domain-containing protein n=1 Tax=Alteribacillus bidgolensis TaxID=930129 RepID=A0A1G8FZC9_9BACI|nr:methyltransferase domain-containing protein [Alteribacillus bidgolensis]SDH87473.1 Methyltransferase domain-containing protein [Alteribacillus bidgolensis]